MKHHIDAAHRVSVEGSDLQLNEMQLIVTLWCALILSKKIDLSKA